MKKLQLYLLSFLLLSISSGTSYASESDASAIAINTPQKDDSLAREIERVHDMANLYNTTLIDKLENKLNEMRSKHGVELHILTLAPSQAKEVEKHKANYLQEENDALILILANSNDIYRKLEIFSMPKSELLMPQDSCKTILEDILKTSISKKRYEAGTLNTVDSLLKLLDEQKPKERTWTYILAVILGVVLLAYILYRFASSNFREEKKLMSQVAREKRRREREGNI